MKKIMEMKECRVEGNRSITDIVDRKSHTVTYSDLLESTIRFEERFQ